MHFTKAQACGNDFLIIEAESELPNEAELARKLCARTTGIGADGVEFLHRTGERSGAIRLRNADGGTAEISGNGTRCVAAYLAQMSGAEPGAVFTLVTDAGPRACTLTTRDAHRMTLQSVMGVPTVRRAGVVLDEDALLIEGARVGTGNPHFVIRVPDERFCLHGADWETLGRAISVHPDFPAQTNVEFVHVLSPDEISIRIFERGVGPTSSSGTGTCAGAAAAIAFHGCARELTVHAPGGAQFVSWPGDAQEMLLTGPAELVCMGEWFG